MARGILEADGPEDDRGLLRAGGQLGVEAEAAAHKCHKAAGDMARSLEMEQGGVTSAGRLLGGILEGAGESGPTRSDASHGCVSHGSASHGSASAESGEVGWNSCVSSLECIGLTGKGDEEDGNNLGWGYDEVGGSESSCRHQRPDPLSVYASGWCKAYALLRAGFPPGILQWEKHDIRVHPLAAHLEGGRKGGRGRHRGSEEETEITGSVVIQQELVKHTAGETKKEDAESSQINSTLLFPRGTRREAQFLLQEHGIAVHTEAHAAHHGSVASPVVVLSWPIDSTPSPFAAYMTRVALSSSPLPLTAMMAAGSRSMRERGSCGDEEEE